MHYINAKNIILLGSVTGEDKYKLFKSSSILIFPSHYENSPTVLKEAMAARNHIIASDIPEIRYVLKNYSAKSFFKKGDSKDLEKLLLKLAMNEKRVKETIFEARENLIVDDEYAYKVLSANKVLH